MKNHFTNKKEENLNDFQGLNSFQSIQRDFGLDKGFKSKKDLNIINISNVSGGYIAANNHVFDNIPNTVITRRILTESIKGTPMIRVGNGDLGLMVVAGVHGNELPPQIAAIHLIHKLYKLSLNNKLDGTVYIIPFSIPKSTMLNSRWFNGADLNRTTNVEGSLTNIIFKKIKELKLSSIGDFHSTAINSVPGKEGIFCTMRPSPESFHIGKYIADYTESEVLCYDNAGSAYKGALEDECNLEGIPSVTSEVLCPNGTADKISYERSLEQMESYLSYFKIISND